MKQITISLSEYERLNDLVAQADTRHGLEMAALERRYQERIKQMQRDHHAEVTRLESVIAHQAEQVKEMAVYKARAKAGGGTQAQERRRAKGVYRGAEEGKADADCIYHALQGGRIRFCRNDSI